jgi:hypothetical protein
MHLSRGALVERAFQRLEQTRLVDLCVGFHWPRTLREP